MDLNMNTCGFKLRKWGIGLDVPSLLWVTWLVDFVLCWTVPEGVIPNSQMKHQFPWNPSILEVNYMVSHTWIGRIRIQMVNLNTWPTPALGIHGNFPRSICGSVPGRLQLSSRDWKRRGAMAAMVPWPCLLQFLLKMVVFGIVFSTFFPSLEEPIYWYYVYYGSGVILCKHNAAFFKQSPRTSGMLRIK